MVASVEQRKKNFIEKAKEIHGNKYDYSLVDYKNNNTKVKIICPIHGVFEQEPRIHINNKCGCPDCGGTKKSNTEDFIKKAKKVHGDKYDYSKVKYKNARTHVTVICPEHGEFSITPDNHLHGKGCAKCYNEWRIDYWQNLSEEETKIHSEKIKQGYQNMSEDARKKMFKNKSKARTNWWNSLTDEEKKEFAEKIKEGHEKDGIPFSEKMQNYWDNLSDEYREFHSQKIKEAIGKRTNEEKEEINRKISDSWHEKTDEEIRKIKHKTYLTKKKNRTFTNSPAQDIVEYELVKVFGRSDVLIEYKDVRYPFPCDFYIVSLDLFIELNAHWTHHNHFYDKDNPEDIKLYNFWLKKSKSNFYYKSAIDTWTRRDVIKRETAIKNNLNYLVFWDNDLIDFYDWLLEIENEVKRL